VKIHSKKKATRTAWKKTSQQGLINRPDGSWVNRSTVADTSMRRDFSPQSGGK
jgi:hypothetical protein